jgi:hypothetical protein
MNLQRDPERRIRWCINNVLALFILQIRLPTEPKCCLPLGLYKLPKGLKTHRAHFNLEAKTLLWFQK